MKSENPYPSKNGTPPDFNELLKKCGCFAPLATKAHTNKFSLHPSDFKLAGGKPRRVYRLQQCIYIVNSYE